MHTKEEADTNRRPRDSEIDVYGLSHRGAVRAENQDHFLLATINKRLKILSTSLVEQEHLPTEERVAFIAMVADGVGGGVGGERASATALEIATRYLVSSTDCYYRADATEETFIDVLQDAALSCHSAVREKARVEAEGKSMATTLTMWIGVWPWYYLLQVGDSRYYLYREGKLTQVSRDQTLAQELVDRGVFSRSVAERSQFSSVLSSSIGGETSEPVVTRMRADWNNVHLLCTDGLTRHVPDEQIADRLHNMTSSKQVCEQLLQDALDGGGSDNITIVVGRTVQQS
jgi:protein phosphatase